MNAIIDTSSLRALVRYYLPFDKGDSLKNVVREKIENKELTVIDTVVGEIKYQGAIIQELDFLSSKSPNRVGIASTQDLVFYKKFINRVDNEFCNKDVVVNKGLTPSEYDTEKRRFLSSADAYIVLYADRQMHDPMYYIPGTIIVSEETPYNNDGKVFKKIPIICNLMGIHHCSLPTLLRDHFNINLSNHCH